MNYYKIIEPNQHVCHICHQVFKQIYDTNHDRDEKDTTKSRYKNHYTFVDSILKIEY